MSTALGWVRVWAGETLQDWVVMVKVTNTRIEAKNRPHSKEKAFSSIIRGIWIIHVWLSKKFLHPMVISLPP